MLYESSSHQLSGFPLTDDYYHIKIFDVCDILQYDVFLSFGFKNKKKNFVKKKCF